MKHSQMCPKCNGRDIIFVPGSIRWYGAGNNIVVGGFQRPAIVDRFVCRNCGYSEEWIADKDLEKLANSKRPLG